MNKGIITSIILLIVIATLSGCTFPFTDFEYAGDKDPVTVPQGTHNTVILDFKVGVGTINLEVNPTATYLAYIENAVSIREGSGKTLNDAEEVSYSEQSSEIMKVQFDSKDELIEVDYSYDLTIKVCNNITLEIDLEGSVSAISITLTDATIAISTFDIGTSTGNIDVKLGNTQFSDSSPSISSSTGNHDIILTNLNYTTATSWSISTSTGGIDLDLTDTITPDTVSMTHSFDISASTGSITVNTDLHQDYGLKITTSISTGDVTIPGGEASYTSTNFQSATQKYDFKLSVSTGDINFTSG